MTFETSKTLGWIGSLLIFISVLLNIIPAVPFVGIIGIVGAILVLIALHGLSQYYKASGIFRNALYGIVTGIVGVVVAIGVGIAAIIANLSNIKDFISTLYPGWDGNWSSLSGLTPNTSNLNPSDVAPFVAGILLVAIAVLLVAWIFAIISTFFIRRSLKEVSEKSKVGTFGTAGIVLLIGAFLIIIFGLGLILMWIATLILTIAFFNLKPAEQPVEASAYPPPPPPTV
jgi:uncharacterized membrane protein